MTYPDYSAFEVKPAPWQLKGSGLLLSSRFDARTVSEHELLALWLKKRCLGGRGFYVGLSFEESPVGAYSELLVVPGRFQASQGKRYAIAQSFCDSSDAIFNYSNNWGIETELARIAYGERGGEPYFKVQKGEDDLLSMQFSPFGPSIPFQTGSNLVRLISEQGKKRYYLGFSIKGKMRLAKLSELKFDPALIIGHAPKPQHFALVLEEFTLELPIAVKETTIEHFKFRLSQQASGTAGSLVKSK